MLLQRFLFVLVWIIFTINPLLHGAPHNNLVWEDSWCWMDSALQVLASINPIVKTLKEKVSAFSAQEKNDRWEYALHEVLQQIRDPGRTERVNPRKLYTLITGGTFPAFERFNMATGCTMDATYFLNDLLKALVDPISNGLLQEIDSRLRIKNLLTVTDPFEWNYSINGNIMVNYLRTLKKNNITNKADFQWEYFLMRYPPLSRISEYFHISLGDLASKVFLGKWDEYPWLKSYNYLQGTLPNDFIRFTTTKTIDEKEEIYHCYAILLGWTGHATALIEDDENPGTWYYYDDNAADKRLKGLPVPKETVDQVARFNTKYDHKYVMALFYKTSSTKKDADDNPLSIKLENLKQKLKDLSSRLQVLKNNLGKLKQKLV